MGFVSGIDVEGVCDTGSSYLDGLGVFGCESAIFEGSGKEVYDGESEALLGVEGGRLCKSVLPSLHCDLEAVSKPTIRALQLDRGSRDQGYSETEGSSSSWFR